MKIISLVPSFTELVMDLGLENELVGRTRFCERPADKVGNVDIVGGTKNPNIEKIKALEADIILGSKEENRKEDIDALRPFTRVLITDITTVEEALEAIGEIGTLLHRPERAEEIIGSIKEEIREIPDVQPVTAAYFIWRNPWMSIGGDTYISDVMRLWGLRNVCEQAERYPVLEPERLAEIRPELIMLSSEPFPFKDKHQAEMEEYCPDSKVVLVDGQWFSWYGSRMADAFRELNHWRKGLEL